MPPMCFSYLLVPHINLGWALDIILLVPQDQKIIIFPQYGIKTNMIL